MRFTKEQTEIIRAPLGDAAILALAGTAKTSVLAWRIAYLLKHHRLQPRNIVAITYSTKAAHSLADRVMSTVADKCGPILGMADLKITTIHGYAMALLKTVRRFRKYEVIDDATRRLLVRRNFRRLGIGQIPRLNFEDNQSADAPFLTQDPHDIGQLFLRTLDRIREEQLSEVVLGNRVATSYRAYIDLLDRECAWDYAQLITTLNSALHSTEDDCVALQREIAANVRFIAVDEAQDADPAMWSVLTRLRELGANLWCIGDVNQTIFRFRSAAPDRLLDLSDDQPRVHTHTLTHNFRSSDALADVANEVIERFLVRNSGRAAHRLTMRYGRSQHHESGDVAAVRFGSEAEQYAWGAKRLKAMLGAKYLENAGVEPRGIAVCDMAVLVRCRRQMTGIIAAFRAEGVDAVATGDASLLIPAEAEMIAVALDYLACGRASWDSKPKSLITTHVTNEDVRAAIRVTGFDADEIAIEQGIEFLDTLSDSDEWQQTVCLIEIIERFLASMGIAYFGDGRAGEDVRWHAIQRVLAAAAQFQRGWAFAIPLREKIPQFTKWLRIEAPYVSQEADELNESGARLRPDAVSVMSIHAAKGLEFPVVWMPDLAENVLPLRFRPADIWRVIPQEGLMDEQVRRLGGTPAVHLLDESRLWYVGLTRATKWFFGTYAPPKGAKRPKPSPFFLQLERHSAVTHDPDHLPLAAEPDAERLPRLSQITASSIQLTASQLHVYWTCPRQFHLRHHLNFPPPLVEQIGYGRSVHDAVWEVHKRMRPGESLSPGQIDEIASRHYHLPFASQHEKAILQNVAVEALTDYVVSYTEELSEARSTSAEQDIRLDLGDITVVGRADLVIESSDAITLIELKTAQDIGRDPDQMVPRTYALALEATTGTRPNFVETRVISRERQEPRSLKMTPVVVEETRDRIATAVTAIAGGQFAPIPMAGSATCCECDVRLICGQHQDKAQLTSFGGIRGVSDHLLTKSHSASAVAT